MPPLPSSQHSVQSQAALSTASHHAARKLHVCLWSEALCLSSSRLKAEAAPAMPPGKRAKPSVRSLMTDCAKEEAHVHLQFTHAVTPHWCQPLSRHKTHSSWFLPSTGSKQSVLHGKALHPRGLSCTQTTTHPGSLFAYPSV